VYPATREDLGSRLDGLRKVVQVNATLAVRGTARGTHARSAAPGAVPGQWAARHTKGLGAPVHDQAVVPHHVPWNGSDAEGSLDVLVVGDQVVRPEPDPEVGAPRGHDALGWAKARPGIHHGGSADRLADGHEDGRASEGNGRSAVAIQAVHPVD